MSNKFQRQPFKRYFKQGDFDSEIVGSIGVGGWSTSGWDIRVPGIKKGDMVTVYRPPALAANFNISWNVQSNNILTIYVTNSSSAAANTGSLEFIYQWVKVTDPV